MEILHLSLLLSCHLLYLHHRCHFRYTAGHEVLQCLPLDSFSCHVNLCLETYKLDGKDIRVGY